MGDATAAKPDLSLNDLVASVNDAAGTARNVITAMLGTAFTLAATILASTDEAILRDSLNAPFGIAVNVKLSVAYALMPPVFLFLHINALLQLHVLTERISLFERKLRNNILLRDDRDQWRHRLHGFAFVQYLTDDEEPGTDLHQTLEYFRNLLLWIVVQISAILTPIVILTATQVSFLRYQSETITLLHRTLVIIDLIFIVWFQASQENKIRQDKNLRPPTELPTTGLALCLLLFIILWFAGVDQSTIMAILNGIISGWLLGRIAKPSGAPVLIWAAAMLVAIGVWWVIEATIDDGIGFILGFTPFLIRDICHRLTKRQALLAISHGSSSQT